MRSRLKEKMSHLVVRLFVMAVVARIEAEGEVDQPATGSSTQTCDSKDLLIAAEQAGHPVPRSTTCAAIEFRTLILR